MNTDKLLHRYAVGLYLWAELRYGQAWRSRCPDLPPSSDLPDPRQWCVPWLGGPVVSCEGAVDPCPWARLPHVQWALPLRWQPEPGSSKSPCSTRLFLSFTRVRSPIACDMSFFHKSYLSALSAPFTDKQADRVQSPSPKGSSYTFTVKACMGGPWDLPLQTRKDTTCQASLSCLSGLTSRTEAVYCSFPRWQSEKLLTLQHYLSALWTEEANRHGTFHGLWCNCVWAGPRLSARHYLGWD